MSKEVIESFNADLAEETGENIEIISPHDNDIENIQNHDNANDTAVFNNSTASGAVLQKSNLA